MSQTKAFGIFNHHDSCVRNVDTNFNYRSGYKNLNFICGKFFHDLIFFFWFHFSMKDRYIDIRRKDSF